MNVVSPDLVEKVLNITVDGHVYVSAIDTTNSQQPYQSSTTTDRGTIAPPKVQ